MHAKTKKGKMFTMAGVIDKKNKEFRIGVAVCHIKKDNFKKSRGREIALSRANIFEKRDKQYTFENSITNKKSYYDMENRLFLIKWQLNGDISIEKCVKILRCEVYSFAFYN
jgi:hypothetical protein